MALLPNAYLQGEAAGMHMAGGAPLGTPLIPENAIGFFGKHILSAGVYPEELAPLEETTGEGYRAFWYDAAQQRLLGYILIDGVQRAGILTALVREQTRLTPEQMALLARQPGLIAFDPAARAKILRREALA
jgi:hypothetical protein